MAYAVVDGIVTREGVLSFFGTLFTGNEADEMPDFWGILATFAYYLYPKEIMHTIKQAYDDGLIFSGIISIRRQFKFLISCQNKLENRGF